MNKPQVSGLEPMRDEHWVECQSCHAMQSYHGLPHCAYCKAPAPFSDWYTLTVLTPVAARSPAVGPPPENGNEAQHE